MSLRHLALSLLLPVLIASGCAAPKSYVVLLPKDGQPSGEVVVSTAKGTEVLRHPWEKSELRGNDKEPGAPVPVDDITTQSEVLKVLSAMPAQPAHFILYFYRNSTELMPQSKPLLAEIVKTVQQRPAAELELVGHTDTIASESYNFTLGRRRAENVLALLRHMGAAPVRADISTRGKCELRIQTPDQTSEPCNRRVEVTVR